MAGAADVAEGRQREGALREQLAETQSYLATFDHERSQLESTSRAALADVKRLDAVTAALAGHANHKQRIHMTRTGGLCVPVDFIICSFFFFFFFFFSFSFSFSFSFFLLFFFFF